MVILSVKSIDTDFHSIKLSSKSASSLSTYLNSTLTGGSSGVQGFVTKVDVTDGTDPDTLYIRYTKTAQIMQKLFLMTVKQHHQQMVSPTVVVATSHIGAAIQIQAGVYYFDGFFIEMMKKQLY